jgi:predicted RNase H-like HicB family nuclease
MIAIICKNCDKVKETYEKFEGNSQEIIDFWLDGDLLKNVDDFTNNLCECEK